MGMMTSDRDECHHYCSEDSLHIETEAPSRVPYRSAGKMRFGALLNNRLLPLDASGELLIRFFDRQSALSGSITVETRRVALQAFVTCPMALARCHRCTSFDASLLRECALVLDDELLLQLRCSGASRETLRRASRKFAESTELVAKIARPKQIQVE